MLAQVTLAALLALGESQGELWWQREGQNPQDARVGEGIPSYGWLQNFWGKNHQTPIPLVHRIHCNPIAGDRGSRRDDQLLKGSPQTKLISQENLGSSQEALGENKEDSWCAETRSRGKIPAEPPLCLLSQELLTELTVNFKFQ